MTTYGILQSIFERYIGSHIGPVLPIFTFQLDTPHTDLFFSEGRKRTPVEV